MDLGDLARQAIEECGYGQRSRVTSVIVNEAEGFAIAQGICNLCDQIRTACVVNDDSEPVISGSCTLAGIFSSEG